MNPGADKEAPSALTETNEKGEGTSADLQLPCGHLQLENRAYNACVESGLKSIKQAIDALGRGKLSAESVGYKTFQEIRSALDAINALVNQEGTIDWPAFWSSKGIAKSRIFLT
jgi:hypothetical protein